MLKTKKSVRDSQLWWSNYSHLFFLPSLRDESKSVIGAALQFSAPNDDDLRPVCNFVCLFRNFFFVKIKIEQSCHAISSAGLDSFSRLSHFFLAFSRRQTAWFFLILLIVLSYSSAAATRFSPSDCFFTSQKSTIMNRATRFTAKF